MRHPHKAFALILAVMICMVLVSTAFAQSTISVSNVLIVMPPANGGEQGPGPNPEPAEEPEVINELQLSQDNPVVPAEAPQADEEPVPVEALGYTDNPVTLVDLPEGATIEVTAMVRQQGEEPAFGDSVVLRSTLAGLDGYTVALQWQQFKDNQWINLTGATETSLTFVMTPENAYDFWRLTATVYGNLIQQPEYEGMSS